MMQNRKAKRFIFHKFRNAALVLSLGLGLSQQVAAVNVSVTVENLSPVNGLFITPTWVGFHDGNFDTYNTGSAASAGLQLIAEDGDPTTLRGEFASSAGGMNGGVDGVIFGPAGFGGAPIIDPGETTSSIFHLDPTKNRYFNYASMVIPSNDAFIGNDNPLAIFDGSGNFTGLDFYVLGSAVMDAGTEVNNEMDAAFFNQLAGNTGLDELGLVSAHTGFIGSQGNPGGTPIILGGTNPPGFFFDPVLADFTTPGFQLARITVAQVPEPATLALLTLGLGGLGVSRRRSGKPSNNAA